MIPERPFLRLLGCAGIIILLHQGLDLLSATASADAGTPTGRLGIVAVVWSRSPALLAADAFLIIAAYRLSSPWAIAALATVHLVLALAALLIAPFFLADAGRVTGSIALRELTSFRITVSRILVALIAVGIGGVLTGVTLFRAGKSQPKAV